MCRQLLVASSSFSTGSMRSLGSPPCPGGMSSLSLLVFVFVFIYIFVFLSVFVVVWSSRPGLHGQSSPTMFELSWLTIVIVSDHHLYQLWLTQITLSLPSLNPKYNKEDILTPLELTQVRNTNYRRDHQLIQCMGVQNYLRPISIGRSHMECSFISDLSH